MRARQHLLDGLQIAVADEVDCQLVWGFDQEIPVAYREWALLADEAVVILWLDALTKDVEGLFPGLLHSDYQQVLAEIIDQPYPMVTRASWTIFTGFPLAWHCTQPPKAATRVRCGLAS